MFPLFSVVIPLFNKQAHIARSLNSVFEQSIANFEIIVVNDGSTDNGPEIVKTYNDRRLRMITQANAGVSSARNRGIQEATAPIVAFLDADDAWAPKFLETIATLVEKFPQAGIYATAYTVVGTRGRLRKPRYRGIPVGSQGVLIPNYFKSAATGDSPVWTSATCIPKSILLEVGMFPVGEKLGEDHDLWARIALKYPIAFNWGANAVYFMDSENRACIANAPNTDLLYIRRLREKVDKNEIPIELMEGVKMFIAKQLIGIAALNVIIGNHSHANLILDDKLTKKMLNMRLLWKILANTPYKIIAIMLRIKRILHTT